GGLSTCEAALRAIELLEGSSSVAPVRRAFAWVTAQVLRQKGKPEPPGWPLEKDPRLETFLEGIPGSSGPRLLPCPREFGGEQGPGNWGDPADVKGADPDPRGSDGHRKDL
ncbi:MAG TPA: hypothetical protein VEN81_10920, partial [Planctomycetota bacterium]|nr:hypothetical protein [Planctomycetota bacterium]